ncbi:MAG: ABC-F family ATP-binding cassette domain-containing protein [Eubacteriales bacterium]|nr:ABC-F family ATP-binding cassette domain-containing protein [Eubacteriales bacterium]
MADISVSRLNQFFGENQILYDITFDIFPGEKVAIVGPNGAGKTTLFRVLAGELPYETGTVSIAKDRTVGMIDQIPVYDPEDTVEQILRLAFHRVDAIRERMAELERRMEKNDDSKLLAQYGALQAEFEAMGGYALDFEVDKVCNGLEIPKEMREQKFAVLSGGEKTRVNLARIILEDTDILLLDEPTNHLDLDAVEWLGNFLNEYKGTVVTISHDRYFLDQCCDRIIELFEGHADFYAGSYSYYAEERKLRFAQRMALHENQMEELKRLQDQSRKMHQWGTEKMHKRAFSIDKRIARMTVADRPKQQKKLSMQFGDPNYETENILKVRGICKSFDGRQVLHDISFNVRNGERIAILGDNGTGKTTLLNILLGLEEADAGTIKRGDGLKPAYLPQVVHFENENRTLVDTLIYEKNVTPQTARNRLGRFQFSGEDQLKPVSKLSGGEKSRLRLCELMYDKLNMLVLDEPTNHLDILAREWIEEAVEGFTGTLLFVSHDRYFVSRFASRIIVLMDGEMIDFTGNYEQYLAFRERKAAEKAAAAVPKPKKEKPKPKGGTKQLEKKIAKLEREIADAEAQSAALDAQMEAAASDPHELFTLSEQKEAVETQLMELMEQWEQLSAQLEEMQE